MYQWKNGSKYFGEWENGTMHGEGTYIFGIGKAKETDMSENTGMELEVGKEFILGLTAKGMLEISRMMCLKAREPTNS